MSDLSSIQGLLSAGGTTRRGMKILTFGPTGSGKSPLLAAFPRPLMAVDCGEGGIQPYLKPPLPGPDGKPQPNLERIFRGEEDLCLTVSTPDELDRAIDFMLKHEDKFASGVFDGYNLSWDDHMDYWANKNPEWEGEIKGGQWRLVKGPWKARQKKLMRSSLNIGFTAWLRDISFEKSQARPGRKAKLEIKAQEVAAIEKSVPYTVDIVFQMRVLTDKLNRPMPKHEIIIAKARRPRTISPDDLYVGKTFEWRSDKEEDLWALAVAPYVDDWKKADPGEPVDFVGMDAEEAVAEEREMNQMAGDVEAGRMVREMYLAFEEGEIKDMESFKHFWNTVVGPTLHELTPESQKPVLEAKEHIKQRLNGGND